MRCQFIQVEKKKETELLLTLDTTNAITRAHVRPNLGHEVYMFHKFGIANKERILDRLSQEQRHWAEVEMSIETQFYHGVAPWYNSPCVLIAQLVWKEDESNIFIANETAKLKALSLEQGEMEKRIDKSIREEEDRLKDKDYKHLMGKSSLLFYYP